MVSTWANGSLPPRLLYLRIRVVKLQLYLSYILPPIFARYSDILFESSPDPIIWFDSGG